MTVRVGVLRGGPSNEHEVSLKTGENILANLPEKYSGHDIILTKNGDWLFNRQFSSPEKIFHRVNVVFNALHGYFGEDGKVQQILEYFNVPYTGSGVFASALGMNKILSRDIFSKAGLNMPKGVVINAGEDLFTAAKNVLNLISPPWVVKPFNGGSSIGVFIVQNFNDLIKVISFEQTSKIIVEEYIKGREATCGVIENFRVQEYYSLPTIEIIPSDKHKFFNYQAKYSGQSREICPGNFDRETKDKIEEMAKIAHQVLGCRHYSRQDFRISERAGDKGKVYILEANTLPGLTTESLIPKAVEAIGSSYPEFLDHLINLALKC